MVCTIVLLLSVAYGKSEEDAGLEGQIFVPKSWRTLPVNNGRVIVAAVHYSVGTEGRYGALFITCSTGI